MNKIINLLSVLCFIAVIASSCEKEPIIELSQSSFSFSEQGGSQIISFSTNKDWSASVLGVSWCSVSPASGSSDVKSITISTTANDTYNDRAATITIKSGELIKSIIIAQKEKKGLILTKRQFDISDTSSVFSVELKSNLSYVVSIPNNAQTWIKQLQTKSLLTEQLQFEISRNILLDQRYAKIVVSNSQLLISDTIFVIQQKAPKIPEVRTESVSKIKREEAIVEGSITSDGGGQVTESGICWSTRENPTIEDEKLPNSSKTNLFSLKILNLQPGTVYYTRSYATNRSGTGYGTTKTFKTFDICVEDIEGNCYTIFEHYGAYWMGENLKTTSYRNGDPIPTTLPTTLDIVNEKNPKYQWAYQGNDHWVDIYGRLYTWYAATDSREICPIGWHLPSKEEMQVLYNTGGFTKESGIEHWQSPNIVSNYESKKFKGLPAGMRWPTGFFSSLSEWGLWWCSSSEYQSTVMLENDNYYPTWIICSKITGLSVRCIKD